MADGGAQFGIAICGSGIGISIACNRYTEIRAALCTDTTLARLSREHNDANVCSLPGRFISVDTAKEIVEIFLSTNFEGGRHKIRIDKIPVI